MAFWLQKFNEDTFSGWVFPAGMAGATLEEAIKNNLIELQRLTDDESTPDEDVTAIALELRFLKARLRQYKGPEAEARYELSGKFLMFELKLGDRVVLEGLPGRPSVVWSADGGVARSHTSEWRSSRSLLMADGTQNVLLCCCYAWFCPSS